MANKYTKGSVVAVMCVSLVGSFEGLRQNAYPDPATMGKPWTVCYGETKGVHPGDYHSIQECKMMLQNSLQEYADGISKCVKVPLPDKRFVALISFAYNLGVSRACKSDVVREINAGHTEVGCDDLLHWNKAAGITFPGLTRRRTKEREYCMDGV